MGTRRVCGWRMRSVLADYQPAFYCLVDSQHSDRFESFVAKAEESPGYSQDHVQDPKYQAKLTWNSLRFTPPTLPEHPSVEYELVFDPGLIGQLLSIAGLWCIEHPPCNNIRPLVLDHFSVTAVYQPVSASTRFIDSGRAYRPFKIMVFAPLLSHNSRVNICVSGSPFDLP